MILKRNNKAKLELLGWKGDEKNKTQKTLTSSLSNFQATKKGEGTGSQDVKDFNKTENYTY